MQRIRRKQVEKRVQGKQMAGLMPEHHLSTSSTWCCTCILAAKAIKSVQPVTNALLSFFWVCNPRTPQHRQAGLQWFAGRAGRGASPPRSGAAVLRSSSARNHVCRAHITFSSPFKGCIRELIPAALSVVPVCQILIRQRSQFLVLQQHYSEAVSWKHFGPPVKA